MDILSIIKLLGRQKWVVLVTSVVAVTLLVLTVVMAPPMYRASSAVVLLNPPAAPSNIRVEPGTEAARRLQNPYARFNDLSVVVDIVRRIMASQQVDEVLRGQGLVGEYTVAANIDFYRGPIIDVAAEAPRESDAINSTQLVVAQLESTLQDLQANQGTDPIYYISADVVVPATKASRVISSTLRRVIAVGAASVFLVLGSAIVVDSLQEGRRRKRRSSNNGGAVRRDAEPHREDEAAAGRLSLINSSEDERSLRPAR